MPDPELARWVDAWLACMREAGHTRAMLHLWSHDDGLHEFTISWTGDEADLEPDPPDLPWKAGIKAFVLCEPLRPACVQQIPLVHSIIEGHEPCP